MAFPQKDDGPNQNADNGTASHEFAADLLSEPMLGIPFGVTTNVNGAEYIYDEERAEYLSIYVDDVRRRAIGGKLFVEQRLDLSAYLGEGQGGTVDALIYLPDSKTMIVEDLKYGVGERVSAQDNPQLMLYALGALQDVELMGYETEQVTVVICQPRLNHIDEFSFSVEYLMEFAEKAALAVKHAQHAITLPVDGNEIDLYLTPGEKQCRWCRNVTCKKRARMVAESIRADFDELPEKLTELPPVHTDDLGQMYAAVPFVQQWCKAVAAEAQKRVAGGEAVMGRDGKPLKFVEGAQGDRKWDANKLLEVESMLVGQLGPKAYQEPKLLTAPAAAKFLDKKKSAATWDLFKGFITRAPGKPVLALGSDPRPGVAGASASEFEDVGAE